MYTTGRFATAARHVQRDSQALIPENTIIAYKAKAAEFIVFCNTVYSNHDYPQTVTEEKVFGFLFYQAYRGKRRKGRSRRGHARPVFDMSDYESVMAKYNIDAEDNDAIASLWDTEIDVVGYDVINQCLCACLDLLRHQRSRNANNLFIHDIRSERVQQLLNVVARRKKRVAALRFDEKIDHALSPYMNVQHINQIEDFLFTKNCFKPTYHVASLRDRFTFLMTHGSVLRGESLIKGKLSDMCDIVKTDEGVQTDCHILLMQIMTGKTNGTKTLYGRVMRHRDVNMCPIGALGFYLMARFHQTRELSLYDFGDNSTWFNARLLVDCNRPNYERSIKDKSYYRAIEKTCKALNIHSKHYVHLGRGTGAVYLELQEIDPQYIKMMGNWNVDVREDRYSTKLPLKAMRALAGHSQQKGGFFLPRSKIEPPAELCRQVFPFFDDAVNTLGTARKPTAAAFLNLLKNLQCVVLQDAAIMIHKGRKHHLFSLPVFATDSFKEYQAALIDKVARTERAGVPTSVEQSIDIALPGVRDSLHNIHSEVHTTSEDVAQVKAALSKFDSVGEELSRVLQDFLRHVGSFQVPTAATRAATTGASDTNPRRNRKTLYRNHTLVSSMWDEWFGKGDFESNDYPGGIEELEKTGCGWRKHFSTSEQKHFSRLKCIIKFVENEVAAGKLLAEMLREGDDLMKTKKTLSTVHVHLKKAKSFRLDPNDLDELTARASTTARVSTTTSPSRASPSRASPSRASTTARASPSRASPSRASPSRASTTARASTAQASAPQMSIAQAAIAQAAIAQAAIAQAAIPQAAIPQAWIRQASTNLQHIPEASNNSEFQSI